jgi:hypothetical protein
MMKKLWIVGLVVAFIGAAPLAYAGCGHCEGSKKAAMAKDTCSKCLEGITLTDEQKAKVDEIAKACDGSKDGCKKAMDSMRALLTEDQQKIFDANMAKCSKGGGCCAAKPTT